MFNKFQLIFISSCLASLLLLTGCASNSVNSYLTVSSTEQLNSSGNNHPAPVQMQVYYLRDALDFNKAEFFALYDSPRKALGTDLIKKTDKIILPAHTVDISLKLNDNVKYVGLLVAFTKLRPEEDWRFVIPTEQLSKVKKVNLIDNRMEIELVDPSDPIVLAGPEEAVNADSSDDSFSLDDMKKKQKEFQDSKDSFSPDKVKEKYSDLNPLNKSKSGS